MQTKCNVGTYNHATGQSGKNPFGDRNEFLLLDCRWHCTCSSTRSPQVNR